MAHANNNRLATVDVVLIRRLVERVTESPFFQKRTDAKNNLALLQLFARKYPDRVSETEVRDALGPRSGAVTGEIKRFRDRLETTFLHDRDLWRDQLVLLVPEEQPWRLYVDYISEILPATSMFWFQQSIRLGQQDDHRHPRDAGASRHQDEARNHLIVFSEPLFFFSKTMHAYIRLLDVNYEGRIDKTIHDKLVESAELDVREKLPKMRSSQIKNLGLVPVRHYLPAGDAYAASAVRGWFRTTIAEMGNVFGEAPEYREASQVAADDYHKNLVVLGSRNSLNLFADFQEEHPELLVTLTRDGIVLRKVPRGDDVDRSGFKVAFAVVTMWAFEGGNAHTYIVSNHTRATNAVVNTLLNPKRMEDIAGAILVGGKIPDRFQLAFKVPLGQHDVRRDKEAEASVPILLDAINSY